MRKYILIIVASGLFVFGNAVFNGFVWDDEEMIVNNHQIRSLANLPAFFSGSTFNSGGADSLAGLYYKPLMTTAFALVHTVFGLNAAAFHLVQIILHLANASFLFLVLAHIFKSRAAPFAISLIFLVHPINTEAVIYLADYQEVLFFFFGILALWYAFAKPQPKIYWLATFLTASFLSKETGLVMATISFTALWLFASKEKLAAFLKSAAIAFGLYCFLRFGVAQIFLNKHGLTPMSLVSLPERLSNIPAIIFFYLKTFFWPEILTINQQWFVRQINLWQLAVDAAFFAALAGGYFWTKNRRLYFLFLIWFLLGLGLHLQIFPLDLTVSDRWFYLPQVGLLGILTLLFSQIPLSRFRSFIPYLLSFVLLILSLRTFARTFDWRDGYTLYSRDIKTSPDAFDLQNNYGVELFRQQEFEKAKIHFQKSVELAPHWWTNWNNLGAIAQREGNYDLAKEYYQKAINNGHYYLAYENMAKLLYFQFDKNEGKKFAQDSLRFFPYNQTLQAIAFASKN